MSNNLTNFGIRFPKYNRVRKSNIKVSKITKFTRQWQLSWVFTIYFYIKVILAIFVKDG